MVEVGRLGDGLKLNWRFDGGLFGWSVLISVGRCEVIANCILLVPLMKR